MEGFPDAGGDYESVEDSTTGMAAVPSYIDEDLSYEITDQSYDYTDNEKETTVITFQVRISGSDWTFQQEGGKEGE